jgi:phage shock protein PspC (stress-responsive transcriptional regulator)
MMGGDMAENKRTDKADPKRFYKSRKNRMIDGVCGGLAEYLGADVTLIRILWLLSILIQGVGAVAYILAMIIVPVNPAHANLKEEEKKKGNPALIWGSILIVLGFLFLYDRWDWHTHWDFPFRIFPWWRIPWETLWPLALIALGIVYIFHVLKKSKKEEDKTGEENIKKTRAGKKDTAKGSAPARKTLFRSQKDKLLAGVCGGLARHFGIDPTIIRIGYVALTLITHVVFGILAYIVFIFVIPQEESEKSVS